jgi:hypothetical protein
MDRDPDIGSDEDRAYPAFFQHANARLSAPTTVDDAVHDPLVRRAFRHIPAVYQVAVGRDDLPAMNGRAVLGEVVAEAELDWASQPSSGGLSWHFLEKSGKAWKMTV